MELDKVIHEPVRLRIMMVLAGVAEVDFNFLLTTLALTRGNLSRHVEKLESAGYVEIKKTFVGKMPNTSYKITRDGQRALGQYWKNIDEVRRLGES